MLNMPSIDGVEAVRKNSVDRNSKKSHVRKSLSSLYARDLSARLFIGQIRTVCRSG
ncbi:hypothetical protein M408DRAFT_261831 [Serendipita vermifera MAFF 305830]|uniref:Uncharacterized protein n=1 Tax=Serendipita vermifera MAFF 305830 TaxID=933852 RepID=A0A0C2WAK5_SERVB|nr:hypothetical protein M408DRAFT_261831 [Serendipita vermifera MAFF 305830]